VERSSKFGEGDVGFKVKWFVDKLSREIDDGAESFFWVDPWFDGKSLKNLYPHLYSLAEDKQASVRQVVRGEGEGSDWYNRWRGNLVEEDRRLVEEIRARAQRVVLKDNVRDRWVWDRSVYSVKVAYSSLINGLANGDSEDKAFVAAWSKLVPLKVSVLVWRIWQNKIPTRDNLIKRGILV